MTSKVAQGLLAAAAVLLAAAAPAGAADYFAAPGASGTSPCPRTAPCSLLDAVSHSGDPGDRTLLEPGVYEVTSDVSLFNEGLGPAQPGTRPLIRSTTGNVVAATGADIEGISIDLSGLGASFSGLVMDDAATARRISLSVAGGDGLTGALVRDHSVLEDSTVLNPATFGSAIVTSGNGGGGTIRNVTAVATGTESFGLRAPHNFGEPQTVLVQNSFLRGEGLDLAAIGDSAGDIALQVTHSNYADVSASSANATITDLGGRQTAAGMFTGPGTGDFHQLPGSPTINAGAAVPGLSALDFEGQPRIQQGVPDIGADEFQAAPPAAPQRPPKKRCKAKKKKRKGKKKAALADAAKKKGKKKRKCKKKGRGKR
jgi:hypothetical protein